MNEVLNPELHNQKQIRCHFLVPEAQTAKSLET